MTQVSPAMIKQLRESTGAGMMDCKAALVENNGDIEAAVDWLRTKGLAKAAKKSGRVAAEGLVAVATNGTKGAMIELNSETDFVSRNEQFQAIAEAVAGYALDADGDIEKLKAHTCSKAGKPVQDVITDAVATIGENIQLRRSTALSVSNGAVVSYVHSAVKPGLGKIGVLVALESSAPADKLNELGKQIAMHVAAAKPDALTREEVDAEAVERERSVFREQALASGKPENVVEKMIEGRIRKYYEEVVLLEQPFVMDGKTPVSEIVAQAAKDFGADVKLAAFSRFTLGEGVEKAEEDFAAEVAKVANA